MCVGTELSGRALALILQSPCFHPQQHTQRNMKGVLNTVHKDISNIFRVEKTEIFTNREQFHQ